MKYLITSITGFAGPHLANLLIDIQVQIPNIDKMRSVTGWKPEIPIEKTLKDLLEYWVKKLESGAKTP